MKSNYLLFIILLVIFGCNQSPTRQETDSTSMEKTISTQEMSLSDLFSEMPDSVRWIPDDVTAELIKNGFYNGNDLEYGMKQEENKLTVRAGNMDVEYKTHYQLWRTNQGMPVVGVAVIDEGYRGGDSKGVGSSVKNFSLWIFDGQKWEYVNEKLIPGFKMPLSQSRNVIFLDDKITFELSNYNQIYSWNGAKFSERTPPFSQIFYVIDTIVDGYVAKTINEYQSFDPRGLVSCYDYNIGDPKGIRKDGSCNTNPYFLDIYLEKSMRYPNMFDTAFSVEINRYSDAFYKFNNEGMLQFYKDPFYEFYAKSNDFGLLTNLKAAQIDERSGKYSWLILQRDYNKNLPRPEQYKTVNGKSLLDKPNKNIVDYYLLTTAMGIFEPEHSGGEFDVRNGYFEIQDEGTGAGLYIEQLVLFKKNDGTDILAIASRSSEAVNYVMTSSYKPPVFYKYTGSTFEQVDDIFPDLSPDMFSQIGEKQDLNLETYYLLPQKGLSITYNVNQEAIKYCENLEEQKRNYSEAAYKEQQERCAQYAKLVKTKIELPFNKETGKFEIKM